MSEQMYDVVIVGAGVSGAIVGKELARNGYNVLVLEAGLGTGETYDGYLTNLDSYYMATAKVPESPYPFNPNAPQPTIPGVPPPYFIQQGPVDFRSTYARIAGGTTMHWMGTCLRMLPEDFEMYSRFGVGRDWPLSYEDMRPYYDRAEFEIGVSADVQDQEYLGVTFPPGYVYPMKKIPPSWIDRTLATGIDGMTVQLGPDSIRLQVRSTPAGRNSIPNPDYRAPEGVWVPPPDRGKRGYTPVGAVDNSPPNEDLARDLGERCAGNSACVPICPIQAKYNALKTISKGGPNLKLQIKSVASRILVDSDTGRISGIEVKRYVTPKSPEYTTEVVRGKFYVLAAHAVENAKLMLASGLARTSGQLGGNLMDHPSMVTWGMMPANVGAYWGPISTSGIEDARGGRFRTLHSAFRIEIGNDGWLWPTGGALTAATNAISKNLFGKRLRDEMQSVLPRQFRFAFLIEQLPETTNRVTIDPQYRDAIGNYRPVIRYSLDDYVLAGMSAAAGVSTEMFARLGATDYTDPNDPFLGTASYLGQSFAWDGAGHYAGTHLMGNSARNSVVDRDQRCWEHPNLLAIGCGAMPSMGTSNPTLTVAALGFRAVDTLLADLRNS